jgi:hypothetical protein
MTLRWGVRTGTGTLTPLPLVPVRRPPDAAALVRPPGVLVALAPEVRPAELRVPDVPPALLVDDALLVEALVPEVLPAARDVPPPEVRALEVRALEVLPPDPPPVVRPLEVLLLDVPPPDVLAAEIVVREEAFPGAVFSLVARPASAIPAHPPAHVPERVVRLSPCCFRERAVPSVAWQIQTDLFPGHGGLMGSDSGSPGRAVSPATARQPGTSSGQRHLTDGYDHDTSCPRYPASPEGRGHGV